LDNFVARFFSRKR